MCIKEAKNIYISAMLYDTDILAMITHADINGSFDHDVCVISLVNYFATYKMKRS